MREGGREGGRGREGFAAFKVLNENNNENDTSSISNKRVGTD